jgi:Phage integrase family
MEAGTEKVGCPWNKGKLVGQKLSLKAKEIWAVRFRLQLEHRTRDLALFNLGIDSKLRGCDLVTLRVRDVVQGGRVCARAIVMQQKTQRPVKFEITEQTSDAVGAWVSESGLRSDDFLFPSRIAASPHLTTRQYGRILKSWVAAVGLDPHGYGTHSMGRTKATLIYRRTRNLRAVQRLLGHTKIESTVRYLGVEVDDALQIAEQTDVRPRSCGADRRAGDGKGATSPGLGARRGDDDPGHSTQTDVSVHAQRLGNPHEICLPCLLRLCGKIVQKLRQTERTRPGD